MYTTTIKRSWRRPFILSLFLLVIVVACGGGLDTGNWVGLAAYDTVVYVADGKQVTAVDVVAQKPLWSFPPESSSVEFFAAPAVDDNHVIIGDYGAKGGILSSGLNVSVYAIDNVRDTAVAEPSTVWHSQGIVTDRIIAQPLLLSEEQLVIVGTADNRVIALDASDAGSLVWDYVVGHSIWAQPTYADGTLYIAGMDKHLYALEATTGELLWQHTFVGALPGRPLVVGDYIYVGSFDKKLHALERATGEEAWVIDAADWIWSAPTASDSMLYFADIQGNVYAVDLITGTSQWQTHISGQIQADLRWVDGIVYVASTGNEETNEGLLLALDDVTGEVVWEVVTPASIHTSPVVVEDMLVVALEQAEDTDPLLIVYDRDRGTQIWQFVPTK